MANKLGFCRHCYKEDETPSFFEVNPKLETINCPICGKDIASKDAISDYEYAFDLLYEKAEMYLYKAHDYERAYNRYNTIISLNPKEVVARYGRVISLLYCSTLRDAKFDGVGIFIKDDRSKYLRKEEYSTYYYHFLKAIDSGIDTYLKKCKKLLTFKNYFYDFETTILYYRRVSEIKSLKKILKEEVNYLYKNEETINNERFLNKIDEDVSSLDDALKTKFGDINGIVYKFNKMDQNSNPIVGYSDERKILTIKPPKTRKCLDHRKGFSYINDSIYKKSKFDYVLSKFTLPILIVCLCLSATSLVLGIGIKPFQLIGIILSLVFLAIGFASIILHTLWNSRSKNRNYLLMKPFKRK